MEMENQDIKVEVVDQTQPLGIELTLYIFRCKFCGRVFFDKDNQKPVVNQAKRHLSTHGKKVDKIEIRRRVIEI